LSGEERFPGWREWPPLRAWEDKLTGEGWALERVAARDLFARRDGELLFGMVEAAGLDPEGKPLLPYVLVRGAACMVVPVARNRDTGEKRFVMILQRRVGSGDLSLEFPAGMVDAGESPAAAAARELAEETGLDAKAELVPLWDVGLYSSPGLSDEHVFFYAAEFELSDAEYRALEGGDSGHADEGEHITTTLKTYAQARAGLTSEHPLLALFLYREKFGDVA
jgi:8-oxo-dGTP pyrophosphatase MutT (NUDIX family)